MKFFTFVLAFVLSTLSVFSSDTTRVLFIGNSLTYFNNMPQTFESIANSLDNATDVTMYAPGGVGLVRHASDSVVYSLFRQGIWDAVIIQPGTGDSAGAAFGGAPKDSSVVRIKLLRDSVYKYNPCCKLFLYEISNGVIGNSPSDLSTYNQIMDIIRSNFQYFSDSTQTSIAPVGEVFRTQWNNDTNILLWNSVGDIHPNARGSYLAACTFYASVFRTGVLGSDAFSTLSEQEAAHFQQITDSVVLGDLEAWNIGPFDLEVDFEFVQEDSLCSFDNLSQNADSVHWSFGDGNVSSEENPSHIFVLSGNYEVTLTAYKHGCPKQMTHSVSYISSHISNLSTTEFEFYPNPIVKGGSLRIDVGQKIENRVFVILDLFGREILRKNINSNTLYIPSLNLERGTYILRIGKTYQKLLIN